jgi:hypothetical protein
LRQRTRARAHALVGWLSGRLDSSVRPCGRARGVAGVGVVYQLLNLGTSFLNMTLSLTHPPTSTKNKFTSWNTKDRPSLSCVAFMFLAPKQCVDGIETMDEIHIDH